MSLADTPNSLLVAELVDRLGRQQIPIQRRLAAIRDGKPADAAYAADEVAEWLALRRKLDTIRQQLEVLYRIDPDGQ